MTTRIDRLSQYFDPPEKKERRALFSMVDEGPSEAKVVVMGGGGLTAGAHERSVHGHTMCISYRMITNDNP